MGGSILSGANPMSTWIESHDDLPGHPKTIRVHNSTGIPIATIIGGLHCLWYWALKYRQDGDLTGIDDRTLWSISFPGQATKGLGRPKAWVNALLEAGGEGRYGFLERHEDGKTEIHDWYDFAGKLIERRKRDARRKSRGRPVDFRGSSDGTPRPPTQQSVPTHQPSKPIRPTGTAPEPSPPRGGTAGDGPATAPSQRPNGDGWTPTKGAKSLQGLKDGLTGEAKERYDKLTRKTESSGR